MKKITDKEAAGIMYTALQDVISIMGPWSTECLKCPGCQAEWEMALEAIYKVFNELGHKHQYSDHPSCPEQYRK